MGSHATSGKQRAKINYCAIIRLLIFRDIVEIERRRSAKEWN